MTPRDMDALSDDEYRALVRYQTKEVRETEKAIRQANRKR
jgi:hypothetical protein